jgi:hypothetical protein
VRGLGFQGLGLKAFGEQVVSEPVKGKLSTLFLFAFQGSLGILHLRPALCLSHAPRISKGVGPR